MPYSYGDPSLHTRSAVRRAGERVAQDAGNMEDEEIVRNWRNSHAFVMTTFRNTLTRYINNQDEFSVIFAQRLKRLNTIIDKLKTGRARDLSTMHDLAGCRLIFDRVEDLAEFREKFHQSRARHKRLHPEKYDYIATPKETGYRGIHDVFSYHVDESSNGSAYNGLRIEIQYRTKAQHAWATAVEISDLLDGHRIKFDKGVNVQRERLFVLASEYIARTKEDRRGFCPTLSDADLVHEMQEIESSLHTISNLSLARRITTEIPRQANIVLHFTGDELRVQGFTKSRAALAHRDRMEKQYPEDDVVYVSGENPAAIQNAFRNYFKNAADFVDMLAPAFEGRIRLG
ncbi:RelA/SpoT domain-containing protein [Xanthomonas sp. WHRI 8393]|uniref:RelA/SpoT domain-containing protein n=1 Tax=Xanthomonas sp. WHRI 8393 TaxID=3161574 RepID=UPI0032E91D77